MAEYDYIATTHPGWSLSDIKQLTIRERRYWVEMTHWRLEQQRGR